MSVFCRVVNHILKNCSTAQLIINSSTSFSGRLSARTMRLFNSQQCSIRQFSSSVRNFSYRNLKPEIVKPNNRPYEVNTKVSQDVLVYQFENPRFFKLMSIFGFGQCVFWTYLMGFTYTNLRDVSPEEESKMLGLDEGSLPWWRKINLGSNMYRNGLSSLCFIFGKCDVGLPTVGTGQVSYGGIRRSSASPRPPCDGTPSLGIRLPIANLEEKTSRL